MTNKVTIVDSAHISETLADGSVEGCVTKGDKTFNYNCSADAIKDATIKGIDIVAEIEAAILHMFELENLLFELKKQKSDNQFVLEEI